MAHDKEVTTNDLALMIGKGFEEVHVKVDKGFEDVNKRLDKLEHNVEKLQTGQETLFEIVKDFSPKKINKLEETVDNHEKRIKKLETKPA